MVLNFKENEFCKTVPLDQVVPGITLVSHIIEREWDIIDEARVLLD